MGESKDSILCNLTKARPNQETGKVDNNGTIPSVSSYMPDTPISVVGDNPDGGRGSESNKWPGEVVAFLWSRNNFLIQSSKTMNLIILRYERRTPQRAVRTHMGHLELLTGFFNSAFLFSFR